MSSSIAVKRRGATVPVHTSQAPAHDQPVLAAARKRQPALFLVAMALTTLGWWAALVYGSMRVFS